MTHNRPRLAIALLAPVTALSACQSDYAVDVRNHTAQPIYIELLVRYPSGAVTVNQAARLGPGDRGELGPIRTGPDNLVSFRADALPNPQRPAWLDLSPGLSVIEVQPGGEQSNAPLRLRPVEH